MGRQDITTIRQTELIEAVIASIHRHGFASLTVSQIAKEAQTSTGSVHYYFGGKDALLEATMRHLLSILRTATVRRLRGLTDPSKRLFAIVSSNFDELLYTNQHCRVWTQFWAYAPYTPNLARLQRVNKTRVASNLRSELKQLLPSQSVEIARVAIQSYMDGVWVHAAQSGIIKDEATIQSEAEQFLRLLMEDNR